MNTVRKNSTRILPPTRYNLSKFPWPNSYADSFFRFALRILFPEPSLCIEFIDSASVIGFPVSSDEFVENKQLNHESKIFFSSLVNIFHSYFIKAIHHTSYGL